MFMTPKRWQALRTSGAIATASNMEVERFTPLHSLTLENFSMKKTLIAVAAVAAATSVLAQDATVYGRVDLAMVKNKDQTTVMNSGHAGGSRLGFRGTEDLGGGLKAAFVIEAAFTADAPSNTQLGSRNSFVDLSGGFGTVRVGRHLNPALLHVGAYSAFGTDYGLATGATVLAIEGARYNNALSYMNKFGDVSVMATMGTKEADTHGGDSESKSVTALQAGYASGPIGAHITYTKNGVAGPKALTQLGASYNFGVATALVAYESNSNQDKKKAYSVGFRAPVGAATIRGTYGKDDSSNTKQTAIGADYALSKRTSLYSTYANTKAGAVKNNQFAFGVAHTF